MSKLGNEPAFPMPPSVDAQGKTLDVGQIGLTKRELFAAMAMQGNLANPDASYNWSGLAEDSCHAAEALLAELDKTEREL